MQVRLYDDLVHAIGKDETEERFGKTACGKPYTLNPTLIEVFGKEDPDAKYVAIESSDAVTCLECAVSEGP